MAEAPLLCEDVPEQPEADQTQTETNPVQAETDLVHTEEVEETEEKVEEDLNSLYISYNICTCRNQYPYCNICIASIECPYDEPGCDNMCGSCDRCADNCTNMSSCYKCYDCEGCKEPRRMALLRMNSME